MSIERRLRREQSRQQAKLKNKMQALFSGETFGGKLTGFGAFYKDQDDDGFSMFLSKDHMTSELWEVISDYLGELDNLHKVANEITYRRWEKMNLPSETWKDFEQQDIDETIEHLQMRIKDWNRLVFGSETRPHKGDIRDIGFGSEELRIFLVIVSLIYTLEQQGVIKSDNFNGMSYHYVSGDTLVLK